jgi:hypothetical protein
LELTRWRAKQCICWIVTGERFSRLEEFGTIFSTPAFVIRSRFPPDQAAPWYSCQNLRPESQLLVVDDEIFPAQLAMNDARRGSEVGTRFSSEMVRRSQYWVKRRSPAA